MRKLSYAQYTVSVIMIMEITQLCKYQAFQETIVQGIGRKESVRG